MHDGKRLCGGFRSPLMLAITAFITPIFTASNPFELPAPPHRRKKYITA